MLWTSTGAAAYVDPGGLVVEYEAYSLPVLVLLALAAVLVFAQALVLAWAIWRRWRWPGALAALGGAAVLALLVLLLLPGRRDAPDATAGGQPPTAPFRRVILLGVDGLDPRLLEEFMVRGRLPHFSRLAAAGTFAPLESSNPPQSPVAWASLATGVNPGRHGIFDFIHRDEGALAPRLSLFKLNRGQVDSEHAFGTLRRAPGFWRHTSDAGLATTVLRWPGAFPPERVSGDFLSGLGTPDIHPSLGRYTFYTTAPAADDPDPGKVVAVSWEDGEIRTRVPGPRAGGRRLGLPLTLSRADDGVGIALGDGAPVRLREGSWSPWMPVAFPRRAGGPIRGMVKFHLSSAEPLRLYMTPIEVDPLNPAFAVSAPESFARRLAGEMGRFHTLGLPEMPEAVVTRRLDFDAFLEEAWRIEAERRRMAEHVLAAGGEGLLTLVTDTCDRICHVFWFTRDPGHALYQTPDRNRYEGVIEDCYARADTLLGQVMERVDEGTLLLVVSDHGFASFRRRVHLNRWLIDNGYLHLRQPAAGLGAAVDWSRTRAYAVGYSAVYANLEGREAHGIVPPGAAHRRLCAELAQGLRELRDPRSGGRAIRRVFPAGEAYAGPAVADAPDLVIGYAEGYRASVETTLMRMPPPPEVISDNLGRWTGDHIVDPELVPGVLLANRGTRPGPFRQVDVAPTVLAALGVEAEGLEGRSLLAAGEVGP